MSLKDTRSILPRPEIAAVVFDFDGTLSLVRSGWLETMMDLFTELLPPLEGETPAQARELMRSDALSLNGRPTVFQMIRFAERVQERGGQVREPAFYHRQFDERLGRLIESRLNSIRDHSAIPDAFLVHGARQMILLCKKRGWKVVMLSGTERRHIVLESKALGIEEYFDEIHGPLDVGHSFAKRDVFTSLLQRFSLKPENLLSFGDGRAETQNVHELGGLAVGVASDEARNGEGRLDPVKVKVLSEAGAHLLIPDFREPAELLARITGKP